MKLGITLLTFFLAIAIFAPFISPYSPFEMTGEVRKLPSREHILGTDELGRDILSRIFYGSKYSLLIGGAAIGLAMTFGLPLGLISGYIGGKVDEFIMRLMDMLLSLPMVLLAIALMAIMGPGLRSVIIAVGIPPIPQLARVIRGSTLATKEKAFVEAARGIGENHLNILLRYILPNSLTGVIPAVIYQATTAILVSAGLSFIGIGIQPPTPEWGTMMATGRTYFFSSPHLVLFPGIALMLLGMGLNQIGDGIKSIIRT